MIPTPTVIANCAASWCQAYADSTNQMASPMFKEARCSVLHRVTSSFPIGRIDRILIAPRRDGASNEVI